MTIHPSTQLDDKVHQRVRLDVLTILATSGRADFAYLRDNLEVTDGNLGRRIEVLNDAGYIEIAKTFEGRRPRTWVSIAKPGRRALKTHIAALRQMIDAVPES